ncbi:hypothetical protein MP228_011785 [Amoeboaphelidium protococcarum]|nr:hypothetical protein MP228_011785 [Amoeboaphelidium protococcarum]
MQIQVAFIAGLKNQMSFVFALYQNQWSVIAAIQSELSHNLCLYLSKVDSTGLLDNRRAQSPLISTVIQSHVDWCRKQYGVKRVAVTAKSNPEYLFSGSSKLTSKGRLEGLKLTQWWMDVLQSIDEAQTRYLYVPQHQQKNTLPHDLKLKLKDGDWVNCLPHKTVDQVDLFHDDPFSDYIKRNLLDKPNLSMNTVINDMLPQSKDFINGDVGLIFIDLDGSKYNGDEKGELRQSTACRIDTQQEIILSQLLRMLVGEQEDGEDNEDQHLSFASVEKCLKSSVTLLKLMQPYISTITVEVQCQRQKEARRMEDQQRPVNVLQVKRRK